MRLKYFTLFILSLFMSANTYSQNGVADLKSAESFYDNEDYYQAIDKYKGLVKNNPKNAEALFRLGNAYHLSRNHKGAVQVYDQLTRLIVKDKNGQKKYNKAYYNYGLSLMAARDYDLAKKTFLKFIKLRVKGTEFRNLKRMANNRVKSCDVAIQLKDQMYAREFTIDESLREINSGYSDFAPIWKDKNTLVFTSLNKDEMIQIDATSHFPDNQKLLVSTQRNDEWSSPEPFENFSHDFLHTANGSFSADGKKFVFSRCQENKNHEVRCAIYLSQLENDVWSKPKKMKNKINLRGYTSTQPTLGEYKRRGRKTEILYFASDRPKGRGKLDIWYSTLKGENEWSKPLNAGGVINTKGNDVTPYYHSSTSELYFSSDYHYGLGGYDVFKSYGRLRSFKRPENLGIPVNSSFDDTYFSWRNYLGDGSLVSNRDGSRSIFLENCCDDIYHFDFKSAYIIDGHVAEQESPEDNIENVEIGLADPEHLEYPDSVNWIGQSDEKGDFKLKYENGKDAYIVVAKEGYETHYIKISELAQKEDRHIANISMIRDLDWKKQLEENNTKDKVQVLAEDSFDKKVKKGDIFVMEHIYFDLNAAEIKPEAYQDLILLRNFLNKNKRTSIEIGGHTDNTGGSDLNHKLSQRRANAIRDYLISKGIKQERIVAIGYGEEKPIAPNQNEDGSDNKEGRRLNRRTEVKIL